MRRKGEKEKKQFLRRISFLSPRLLFSSSLLLFCLFSTACSELEKPKTEPFYAETKPPVKKEFRWSNGKMPKSFDPATASAAPETDIVRAVYEGLTDTDPKTLQAIPAVALEWISANDDQTWTFKLRRDAEWTNGEPVTARDFVRSWKRLADLGDKVPYRNLLQNIQGMPSTAKIETAETTIPKLNSDVLFNQLNLPKPLNLSNKSETNSIAAEPKKEVAANSISNSAEVKIEPKTKIEEKIPVKPEIKFGVVAVNDYTLQVSLVKSDKDFPQLVAHPIFRPVYGDGKSFETDKLNAAVVTNGAFRIKSVAADGITLDRDDDFWGSDEVELERVVFVPSDTAEKALAAYKAGDLDVVTNADFEPLALKLLTPFDDFRRTTHGALNYYEINRRNKPFDDNRVRQALAISIDRDRLTEGEMEGSTASALGFTPFDEKETKIVQNIEKAQNLLEDAGFPNGANFPVVRLAVNRNDTQQRVAKSIARMWKLNLNIETKIIVKDAAELETLRQTDDYDLMRRGAVLPSADETANMMTIFEARKIVVKTPETTKPNETESSVSVADNTNKNPAANIKPAAKIEKLKIEPAPTEKLESESGELILNESAAVDEMSAIPLYFPTSYSLVKPYIQGFEMNMLDAPSLKNVKIDNDWQPKKPKGDS